MVSIVTKLIIADIKQFVKRELCVSSLAVYPYNKMHKNHWKAGAFQWSAHASFHANAVLIPQFPVHKTQSSARKTGEMIMRYRLCGFKMTMIFAQVMFLDQTGFFQQPQRTIDSGEGYVGVTLHEKDSSTQHWRQRFQCFRSEWQTVRQLNNYAYSPTRISDNRRLGT